MKTKSKFYEAADLLFKRIRTEQNGNIEKAAEAIVERIKGAGAVHLFDTGHIIDSEMVNRAGGLVLLKRFKYSLTLEANAFARERSGISTSQEGLASYALRCGNVMPNDVMVIGSVSGKTMNVIDLAYECKKMGILVIAITSIAYSSKLKTDHSCGKRLFEIADIVIDNCAPFGDAMLTVEGIEAKCSPASGIAAAYIMWALCADIEDKMLELGLTPGVYKSINYPANVPYNEKLNERYEKTGY